MSSSTMTTTSSEKEEKHFLIERKCQLQPRTRKSQELSTSTVLVPMIVLALKSLALRNSKNNWIFKIVKFKTFVPHNLNHYEIFSEMAIIV